MFFPVIFFFFLFVFVISTLLSPWKRPASFRSYSLTWRDILGTCIKSFTWHTLDVNFCYPNEEQLFANILLLLWLLIYHTINNDTGFMEANKAFARMSHQHTEGQLLSTAQSCPTIHFPLWYREVFCFYWCYCFTLLIH